MALNFSIIVPNWMIWAWRFAGISFPVSTLFSQHCVCWFDRCAVLRCSVLWEPAWLSLLSWPVPWSGCFHGDGNVLSLWGFLVPLFSMDALDVLLKPLSALILAFVLYFKVSGQVPLSVCLFRDLVAPLAWLILSSANRLWLCFWLSANSLWRCFLIVFSHWLAVPIIYFFPIFSSNEPHVWKGPWGLLLSRTLSASVFGTMFFTESKGVILVLVQD